MEKSVAVLFLDGVGLGEANPETNPFMHVDLPCFRALLNVPHLTRNAAGAVTNQAALLGLDALLGVPGLPQSATGQTTILTGRNAPAALGEHYGPYPNQALREMLARDNIFKTLLEAGRPVAYANAYPARFLDRLRRGKGRLSANTQAAYLANLKIRSSEDLRRGRALSAFLSNEYWPEPDVELPAVNPRQAGRQFACLAQEHTLTFFEFWYTDWLGHKQKRAESLQILPKLDDFLAGILDELDWRCSLLLVVSDHGNFEDWTIPKHTKNPALTLLAGVGFQQLVPRLHSLLDVKPALLSFILSP
ncbi:MAG: alkaline phosphatase family protein [Anaerolineae bacterium]|nr:alkaline phosphatase family protein [Anaerolineae bacterium]